MQHGQTLQRSQNKLLVLTVNQYRLLGHPPNRYTHIIFQFYYCRGMP